MYYEKLEIKISTLKKKLSDDISMLDRLPMSFLIKNPGDDSYNYWANLFHSINIKEYEKELIRIERMYSLVRKKYKYLSEEDFMIQYGKEIVDIKNMLERVKIKKAMIDQEFEKIDYENKIKKDSDKIAQKTNDMIDSCNRDIERKIERAEAMGRASEDFWDFAFDEKKQEFGVISIALTFQAIADYDKRLKYPVYSIFKRDYTEIIASRLEYELYQYFHIDAEYILRKKGLWKNEWDIWKFKNNGKVCAFFGDFKDIHLSYINVPLKKINELRKRIKKKQERAAKHPNLYNRPGVIGKWTAIEITQNEMLQLNLDPSEFSWKEIKKAKVSSSDIAKASKEKVVKKSLVSQIASFFARKKDDKER